MTDRHPQGARIEALYHAAKALRDDGDPLLAGQYDGVVGRLSALLASIGEAIPDDGAAVPAGGAFPSMRLDGRVAVVTGGGGGLGTLAACAFADAGADVVVAARTLSKCEATAQRVRSAGRRALALSVDVTVPEQVGRMVDAAREAFGRVDILFNNAGITSPRTLEDSDPDEWFRIVEVNVKSTFLCSRAVIPGMRARGEGRIINMGSILSARGMANRTAYATSKAAVAQLTRSLALELGGSGITVNALGPTVIVTDLNRDLIRRQPGLYDALLARTPVGRLGQPEDIAGALVFLASPAAAFVTGQTIYVDGGYTAG
jgi:NAD(P)-dependent dehydrogenase (short-subunit alcohol dehydrogenase family)